MKILKRLEKSKIFWYLIGISLIFFLLRLPSLIEPNWYGDEGIYQVIGKALSQGRLLYVQIWDNKPPFLYLVYAFFGGNQFQVRLFSLIAGLISTWVFFGVSRLLFKNQKAIITATASFALLFSIPLLEGNIANAENFMLLPIIAAGYLIYANNIPVIPAKAGSQSLLGVSKDGSRIKSGMTNLFLAGLLLGIAFLFKIVAVFDLAAFSVFLFIVSFKPFGGRRSRIKNNFWLTSFKNILKKEIAPLVVGFVIPIGLTFLFFIFHHAIREFTKAVFFSNVGYVGYGNKLIIPQGLLILKLILLVAFSFIIFLKKHYFARSEIFILIWFSFSLFNTYFSGRPYTHYTLILLPSFCLLFGLVLATNKVQFKMTFLLLLLLSAFFINNTFKFSFSRTINYYNNAFSFVNGYKSVSSYQAFFDQKTPRDYEVASFLKIHTGLKDNVFVWGDSAQIYALSEKLPPSRYTVAYHIKQYELAIKETQDAINKSKPKYIVTLPEAGPIIFNLPNYQSKFIFRETSIYERSF